MRSGIWLKTRMPKPDPKPIEGARALLFERLVDDRHAPRHSQTNRVLDQSALKESVRREIERLLNSRCPVSTELIGDDERTVVNYGIPDFSALSPRNSHDRKLLADIVTQTVNAFEPRLRGAQVIVERFEEDEHALIVRLEANLFVGTVNEPVSFPVWVRCKKGEWKVDECE